MNLYGSAGERIAFFVKLNVGVTDEATKNLHRCIREVSTENYFGLSNEFEVFWKDDVGDSILIATWRDLQNFVMYQSRRAQDFLRLFVHPKGYIRGEVFESAANNNSVIPIIVIDKCS